MAKHVSSPPTADEEAGAMHDESDTGSEESSGDLDYAKWPPVAVGWFHPTYVLDQLKVDDSRDIGRSSTFWGRQYYIFGDTFVKDFKGDFRTIISNSIAVVDIPGQKWKCRYENFHSESAVPGSTIKDGFSSFGIEAQFIPLTRLEQAYQDASGNRITIWPFGGLVESDTPGEGWVFFEKGIESKDSNGNKVNLRKGVGIAAVSVTPDRGLVATRVNGDALLFSADEPNFGVFSTLKEGPDVFLYGQRPKMRGDSSFDIVLAKAPANACSDRSQYLYHTVWGYIKDFENGVPVACLKSLGLRNVQQGSIYPTHLFGPKTQYLFVGCTNRGDGRVQMAIAPTPEGQFSDLYNVCAAEGIEHPTNMQYCIYQHALASEAPRNVFFTSSEGWPGGVIGAGVTLKGSKIRS